MRRSSVGALGLGLAAAGAGAAVVSYAGLVNGAFPVDLGVGRRGRGLGPQIVDVAARRELVYEIIAQPYLGRPTRALLEKVRVLERGSDMVLAEHLTPINERLTARTVETVRFTRPDRVDFRVVRGPVPYVVEEFVLTEREGTTRLEYRGELGTDLWMLGEWWGGKVAGQWERAVAESLSSVKAEAERRAS